MESTVFEAMRLQPLRFVRKSNLQPDMEEAMQALCAHGVKTIYYCEPYDKSEAPAIASLYGVELIQVTDYPLSRHFPLVLDS